MSVKKEKDDQQQTDLIKELGLVAAGGGFKSDIQYINIIGSIEGHSMLPQDAKTTKYEHLIPELVMVEENPDIRGLLLILNTVGGDVEAGLALSEFGRWYIKTNRVSGDRRRAQHRDTAGRFSRLFFCRGIGDNDTSSDKNQRHADHSRTDI